MDVPRSARAVKLSRRLRLAASLGVGQARERAREIGDLDVHPHRQRLRHRVDERGAPRLDAVEACELDRGIDDQRQQRQAGDAGESEENKTGASPATRPVREPRPLQGAQARDEARPRFENHSRLCPAHERHARVCGRTFPTGLRERGETFSLLDRRCARQMRVVPGRMRRGIAVALCVRITNVGRLRC